MNRNGSATSTQMRSRSGLSDLAHDVVELGELQLKLLVMDAQASSQRARTTIILASVALAVLLGSVPVALLTLAEVLVTQAEWSRPLALGVATSIGLVISAALFATVWGRIRHGISTFGRSRDEIGQNIAWLKSALRSNGNKPQL